MFTGIISEIGTIISTDKLKGSSCFLKIRAPITARKLKPSDSLSIDGACLTVTLKKEATFEVELIPETLKRTIANKYRKGTKVNIEQSLKAGERFHGHFLSGHVDFSGKIIKMRRNGKAKILAIEFPPVMKKYFCLKCSVAINGVSLTITRAGNNWFEINLIPFTQKETTLGASQKNDTVNVEIDLIARYLESLLKQ